MGWLLDHAALESIAIGAGILGTGGGGNPYNGKLHLRRLLDEGYRVEIVAPEDVPDDALVASVGGIGAPIVSFERLARGDEIVVAMQALEEFLGRAITHLIPGEIGGSNALRPMAGAALTNLPVIDGDGMGRAFPELQMDTFSIAGLANAPAAIADIHHNTAVWTRVRDAKTLEDQARAVTVRMGGSAGFAFPLLSGADAKRTAIPLTITLARRIGEAVQAARREHRDPVEAIFAEAGGQLLFTGKVVDIERRMAAGFARGVLTLDGMGDDRGERLTIEIQNEYLIARASERVLAVVPDLICIVDQQTAEPVSTEVLRYGLRVAVLGMPAPAALKTPAGLAVVGPAAFGYDLPFTPLPGVYGVPLCDL
jgi:DUF917 family protein